MKQKNKQILENTFYQLLIVYTILIILIAFGIFSRYSLQLHIFAFFVGIFGISLLFNNQNTEEKRISKKHYLLIGLALILIVFLRFIPYTTNSIPLGYDSGFFKYALEHGLERMDPWIITQVTMEPGFLYFMECLKPFFSIQTLLTGIFILFFALLGLGVYFSTKKYAGKTAGLIALFVFAFSIVQYKSFGYMYYRNVIGMCLILFSIYFLGKYEKNKSKLNWFLFILLGGLVGAVHRPSFYIFGLSYFLYAFISPYKNKEYSVKDLSRNVLAGILIILIAILPYMGKFWPALYSAIPWVVEGFLAPGEASGTFINFFTYQFSSLFYLPFAIIGLVYFIKKKDFNILVIWAVLNFIIVYFQFFFFNRFIIFLDLVLLILAGVGFSVLIKDTNILGKVFLVLLLLSAFSFTTFEAINSKPLVDQGEIQTIEYLQTTQENSWVISTSAQYSPWILGYSERKTIAPGLFDYDNHSKEEWLMFWSTTNLDEMKDFMEDYEKPLYIFIGKRQKDNLAQFPQCFNKTYELENNKIYNYLC